ncbi:MAG: polysaccharide deacetylase family protein [Ferruginibacter sp.]
MNKKIIFNALNIAGVSKFLRSQKKNKLTVLSLHRISYHEDFFWNPIRPDTFEKLLQYLVQHYSIISFSDIAGLPAKNNHSKPHLILSFDDGYYDFYEHALPLLVKYKLPSNHNIVNACANENHIIWTQRLNALFTHCKKNNITELKFDHDNATLNLASFNNNWMRFYLAVYNLFLSIPLKLRLELIIEKQNLFSVATLDRMMNWNEIIECSRNHVEIGSHTYNHDVLSTITDTNVLQHEIADSKSEIEEKLNRKINILALPNGQGNNQVKAIAEKAGINHVLYVGEKINDLYKYANGNSVHDTYRINIVEETMPEMILRTELFHSKIKRYA